MKYILNLILAVALFCAAAVITGCSTSHVMRSFTKPAPEPVLIAPPKTNQVVATAVSTNAAGVVEMTLSTNTVVQPAVWHTNLVLSDMARTIGSGANMAAQASGVPWAGTASDALLVGLPTLLLGWYNLWQRRKLRETSDSLLTYREVAKELKENVDTALEYAEGISAHEVKKELQSSQLAAGAEVARVIRGLVQGMAH